MCISHCSVSPLDPTYCEKNACFASYILHPSVKVLSKSWTSKVKLWKWNPNINALLVQKTCNPYNFSFIKHVSHNIFEGLWSSFFEGEKSFLLLLSVEKMNRGEATVTVFRRQSTQRRENLDIQSWGHSCLPYWPGSTLRSLCWGIYLIPATSMVMGMVELSLSNSYRK